ncbi:MAG: hypothetical protein AAFR21_18990, partial [Pseudomonadota bacterium]
EDGRIAAQLMETHARHIPLWGGFEQRVSPSETFALNIMSAAGTRRFNHDDASLKPMDFFEISGGASLDVGAFQSPFTRRIWNTQNTNLLQNQNIREHALQEYHHGAEVSPVSLEDRNAILFHYARYRSRFHYGMSNFISGAHSIMPLFSTAVIALCASALETRYVKLNGLNRDIISVCAPKLLSYPFTGEDKRPRLVSQGVSLQDLREPRVLEPFGAPDVAHSSEFGPRTYGPHGEDVLNCLLEPAVRRFGDCFDPRALEWARDDLTSKKPLRYAVHACFLTGLALLFEPDLLHQVHGLRQQPDPLP